MKGLFRPIGVGLFRKGPWLAVETEREFGVSSGGSADGTGAGAPGTVSMVAPTGTATNGSGTGSGAPGTVTLSAPTGSSLTVFMVILAGQSNMEGRATPANGVDRATIDVDVPNFYQYPGQSGQSDYQILTNDTTPLIHQTGYTRTNSVLGPGEYQARQILADNPGSIVVAVPTAVGSTGLATAGAAWVGSNTPGAGGSLFENMINQAVTDYGKIKLQWPGATIKIVTTWVQGEQDALTSVSYSTYYAALANLISCTISRLVAAGVTEASSLKFLIGSMIPLLWDPTSVGYSAAYAAINRAHVMASLNIPNVLYSRGAADNNGSNTGAGGDGLHYLPADKTRTQGTRLGLTLSDTVGPTMTGAATYTNRLGHTLSLPLSSNDVHATYEIVAGLDGARFALTDPYISPAVTWVGNGTGPAAGSYQVNVRARDGSGNYGPTRTYTIAVAADVSPATFFSNGERGFAWDISDLANLSQTIDGLTPVTAVGQPVGYVRDPSPNANHLKAASNGSTRPLLGQDSDGKYYLSFDGVDDVLFAATPFFTPTVSTVYTAIMGIFAAAQSAQKNILSAGSASSGTPFLVPFQSSGTTTDIKQSGRNDGNGLGTFPVLAAILDSTKRVVNSAFSSAFVQRMRDAAARPSTGGAGSYTSTSNSALGTAISADRSALGASGFNTAFYAGRVYSGFVINRYLTDDEVAAGEEWAAHRSLTAALPGEAGTLDGNGAAAPGTVTLSSPTGVASSGSGGVSGSGAGSPGAVTLSAPTGTVSATGSATGSGGAGMVVLSALLGSASVGGQAEDVLTLDEVKVYLGVFTSDKDASLTRMIKRARLWVEDLTGIALLQRQFEERLVPTISGKVRLSKGPLVSVDSVDYLDSAGQAATFTPVVYAPSNTLLGDWPGLARNEAFTITYTAGEDIDSIDDRLKGAILALIEGEFSEGYAYPQRAVDAAERCCSFLTQMVA
jgi:hypothetical protein